MIENYRTGAVWNRFMSNPDVQAGLALAGFSAATDIAEGMPPPRGSILYQNAPNPFQRSTTIRFLLDTPGHVLLTLTDPSGREIGRLLDEPREAGLQAVNLAVRDLASGVYYYNLQHNGRTAQTCAGEMREVI
jgi:hypothetical protein